MWLVTVRRASSDTAIRAADLLQARPQQRVGRLHRPGAQVRGVEGRDDRPVGRPQGEQRQARADRLVDVHDVEVAVLQPPPACARPRPGRSSPGRPSRCSAPAPPGRRARRTAGSGGVVVGRREDADRRGPWPISCSARSRHVELHAAGHVEAVGADDADPHRRRRLGSRGSAGPGPGRGRRRTPAAACASPAGARRSRRRGRRAGLGHRRDLSPRRSVSGTGTRSCQVITMPCRPPAQPLVVDRHGEQRRAGRERRARPARPPSGPAHRGSRPRRRCRVRSRSASSGMNAPGSRDGRQQRAEHVVTAGQRDDPHAQLLAEAEEGRRTRPPARSRSATVVTGAVRSVDQAPAWSQLPRWPRNITTDPPAAAARAPARRRPCGPCRAAARATSPGSRKASQ